MGFGLWSALLWQGAWQGLAAALCVIVIARMGRRWPASLREGLLGVALVKFLVPPLSLPVGLFPWVTPFLQAPAAPAAGTAVLAADGGSVAIWLLALHVLGMACVALGACRSALRVRALRRGARAAEPELAARVASIAVRLGVRRVPAILLSHDAAAPVAIGVWRRAVVLPVSFARSLAPGDLDGVVAHELAHHLRGHLAWAWIRVAACVVWWWHPAVWLVARELRRANEDACDDIVVHHEILQPEHYCDVLMRSAAVSGGALALAAPFAERLHPLGRRIQRLLDGHGPRTGSAVAGRVTIATAALLLLPALPMERATPSPVSIREVASNSRQGVSPQEKPRLTTSADTRRLRGKAPARQAGDARSHGERPDGSVVDATLDAVAQVTAQTLDNLAAVAIGERLDPPALPAAPRTAPIPASGDLTGKAARDERARIAAAYERQIYDDIRDAGAPADVARTVSRSVSQSITGTKTHFWRDAGRAFGRLLR